MKNKIPDLIESVLPDKQGYLLMLPTDPKSTPEKVFVTMRNKKLKIYSDKKVIIGTLEFDKLSLKINT
jgi:hypothetical protein